MTNIKIIPEMNLAVFRKNIQSRKTYQEVVVYPYFSDELKKYGRVVVLSDTIEEMTYLTHRNQKLALIVPLKGTPKDSVSPYVDEIINYVGVDATVFSIFDMRGNKLAEINAK